MDNQQANNLQPEGARIAMHLRITLEDGTVAEDTFDDQPIVFHVGDETIVGGLETVVRTMLVDEHTTVILEPEDGFGAYDGEQIHTIPRSSFGPGVGVAPGLIIGFTTPAGDEVAGSVISVSDEDVEMDFNHPLAGHTLSIDVKVLDIQAPPEVA